MGEARGSLGRLGESLAVAVPLRMVAAVLAPRSEDARWAQPAPCEAEDDAARI